MGRSPNNVIYFDRTRIFALFGSGSYSVFSNLYEASCSEDVRGSFNGSYWYAQRETSVHGNGLYVMFHRRVVTDGPGILQWIDITTGENTTLLTLPGAASVHAISGDVMFISYYTANNGSDFEIYNISDFMNPVLIHSQFLGLRFISLAAVGEDGLAGSVIKNWWDHIVVLARSGESWEDGVDVVYMHRLYKANIDSITVLGTVVYAATIFTNKIYGWDLSDIRNPQVVFSHQLQTGASKLFANQGYGYGWSEYLNDADEYNRGFIEVFKLFSPTASPPTPAPPTQPPPTPVPTSVPTAVPTITPTANPTAAPTTPPQSMSPLAPYPITNITSTVIPLLSHDYVRDHEENNLPILVFQGHQLYLVDGSDPTNPTFPKACNMGRSPNNVIYFDRTRIFALFGSGSYSVFSNLYEASCSEDVRGSFNGSYWYAQRETSVHGNGLYVMFHRRVVTDGPGILQWIDITTGENTTLLTLPGAASVHAISGDVMFISYYTANNGSDFEIYNISDFMNPVLIHSQFLGLRFISLAAVGEDGLAGSVIKNWWDHIVVLARSGESWEDGVDVVYMHRLYKANIDSITVLGTVVYAATIFTNKIYGWDLSDIRNPQVVFSHQLQTGASKLFANQGYGYGWSEYLNDADEYNRGFIEVFKLFSPTASPPTPAPPTQPPPTPVPTSVPTAVPTITPTANPTAAPTTPPQSMSPLAPYPITNITSTVIPLLSHDYVRDHEENNLPILVFQGHQLYLVDGSDPTNPTFPKACNMGRSPNNVIYFDRTRIFALFGSGSYSVFSNLYEASCSEDVRGSFNGSYWYAQRETSVHGNGLYVMFHRRVVTDGPGILQWIDITTGENTTLLTLPGAASVHAISGDVMFISYYTANNGSDFEIYNISDFMNPVLIHSQFLGLRFISLAAVGEDGLAGSVIKNWWDHIVVLARSGESWEDGVDVVYMHRLYKANIDSITVLGTVVYAATIFTNKIYGWDLSDIRNPQVVFSHQLQTGASKLFANQGYGYGWSEYLNDADEYNRGFIEVFKLFSPTASPPTPAPPTPAPLTSAPPTSAPPTQPPPTPVPTAVPTAVPTTTRTANPTAAPTTPPQSMSPLAPYPITNITSTVIPLLSHGYVRDHEENNLPILVFQGHQLYLVDGSDPTNPTFPKACNMGRSPNNVIYFDRTRIFALFGSGSYSVFSNLYEASCSEDVRGSFNGSYWYAQRETSVHGNGLYVMFNRRVVTDGPGILQWIDITTGENTTLLTLPGAASVHAISGDVMFISYYTANNGSDFEIYNISDFMNPVLIHSQFLGLRFISMAAVGEDGLAGSVIKNWWDHIVVLARSGESWEDGVDVVYMHRLYKANIDSITVLGTVVYAATIFTNKIYGWDLSDIRNPQVVFSHQLQTGASKLFANQGYGYGWSEYLNDADEYNRGFIEVFKLFSPTASPPTPSPSTMAPFSWVSPTQVPSSSVVSVAPLLPPVPAPPLSGTVVLSAVVQGRLDFNLHRYVCTFVLLC